MQKRTEPCGIALYEGGLVAEGGPTDGTETWDPVAFREALVEENADRLARIMTPAFAAVLETVGKRDASIALLPPLSHLRAVDLPPMRPNEAKQVVSRDVKRYFVDAQGEHAVAVGRPAARGHNPMVAAAPDALVDAVQRATKYVGWPGVRIVPAHAAWAAAAGDADAIAVLDGPSSTVLRLEQGAPAVVRRLRAADAERIAAALGDDNGRSRSLVVAGPEEASRALESRLAGLAGIGRVSRVVVPDAASLAARYAPQASTLELQSLAAENEQVGTSRRITQILIATAAILALVAVALQLWGEGRELAALRAERARLRPRVESAMAARTAVQQREERARGVTALAGSGPEWSSVIARVALALPRHAHLIALRASADSVVIEGLAASGAEVVQALAAERRFIDVRPIAPFRQERAADVTQEERQRFAISFRLQGGAR